MYSRNDPRLRRTLNQLSQNIESANESAQANIFSFSQNYIAPCFSSVGSCVEACTAPCFPNRDERRRQRRMRGRAELSFDFYDDWENDENDGLLGWHSDELGRLLAGSHSYGVSGQPSRPRAMSYGSRRDRDGRLINGRRKMTLPAHDSSPDPTIIPSSSYFGFLSRLPWKIGGKGIRYKPSAADLIEHPGISRVVEPEEQPLIEDSGDDDGVVIPSQRQRNRSHTTGSGHTADSLSSRGDIFPSEDEDDAIPIDDEFAMVIERRSTVPGGEEPGANPRSRSRFAESHSSTRTTSSRSVQDMGFQQIAAQPMTERIQQQGLAIEEIPSLAELDEEEERARIEEELNLEKKRDAARRLALERGLSIEQSLQINSVKDSTASSPDSERCFRSSNGATVVNKPVSSLGGVSSFGEMAPFPSFDPQTAPESGALEFDSPEESLETESQLPTAINSVNNSLSPTTFVPAKLPLFETKPS